MSKITQAVEFTSTVTSMTVSRNSAGTLTTAINIEGSSAAFGPFVGTVTVTGAGQGGSWHYEAFAIPPGGGNATGSADGSYTALSPTRWRTLGAGRIATDDMLHDLKFEAEFDLEKRSWNGRLMPL